MGETAQQLGQFQDPYSFENLYDGNSVNLPKEYSAIDSLWGKVGSSLGFVDRAGYEEYLKQRDRDYERANINSARAWEEYLDSTKYQRMKADLEKAGVNPYWLMSQGSSASASSSTATGGRTTSTSKQMSSKESMTGIAGFLVAIAKLLAVFG